MNHPKSSADIKKKVPTASMTAVEVQKAELEPKKIAENTANAHPLDEHVSTVLVLNQMSKEYQ